MKRHNLSTASLVILIYSSVHCSEFRPPLKMHYGGEKLRKSRGGWSDFDPLTNSIIFFGFQTTVQISSKLIENCDRMRDHRQTDRHAFICYYSNGTDKNTLPSIFSRYIVSSNVTVSERRTLVWVDSSAAETLQKVHQIRCDFSDGYYSNGTPSAVGVRSERWRREKMRDNLWPWSLSLTSWPRNDTATYLLHTPDLKALRN